MITPLTRRQHGSTNLLALHHQSPQDFPFLLQSAVTDAGRHRNARYDILFAFPAETLTLTPEGMLQGANAENGKDDFLRAFDRLWQAAGKNQATDPQLPFSGGWFVYLGYELAGQIEPRLRLPKAESHFPVATAIRIPAAVINDHRTDETILVAESETLLRRLIRQLECQPGEEPVFPRMTPVTMFEDPAEDYLRQALRVKQYIIDGDVFQVNLSRAWRGQPPGDLRADTLYLQLCRSNPAPFAGLACFPQGSIISSSPERLIRVKAGRAETRPIAGTRPRSRSSRDDAALKSELLAHPKERAEHIMLIDLERNDLGRVCEAGSVEVNEMMVLESYAHVHHIVSNVRGRLHPATPPGEVMRAVFPGGTITGCPKERCMAIIAELEQTARGAYTGSMGYVNHNGDMDLNILIRTITLDAHHVTLRAGAGLVADSVAEKELEETRHKARGLLLALGGTA